MADAHDHGLGDVDGPVAQLRHRSLWISLGHTKGCDLHDIAYLQGDVVQHPGVEGFRLEVDVVPLLTGVSGGDQLDYLSLDVIQSILQIPEGFRPYPTDQADVGCLNASVDGHLDGGIPSELLHQMIQHVTRVSGVSRGADAAGDQHNPRLLPCHVDATGSPLVARQVTLAKSAEAAEVAEGHVEGLVPFEELPVPAPEGPHAREGGRAHGLLPLVVVYPPHLDLQPLERAQG